MPQMPRMNKKCTKIAYKIMGVPPSMAFKRNKHQEYLNKRLIFTESNKAR